MCAASVLCAMVIYALRLMALRRYKFHVVGVGVLIQWFKSFFPVCWLPADHFFAPIPQSVLDDGRLQQVTLQDEHGEIAVFETVCIL